MTYFLSEPARTELIEALVESGMPQKSAEKLANVPDDMKEVDIAMTAHVMLVGRFGASGDKLLEKQGLACLTSYMLEAMNRGYAETDFPISLAAVKEQLKIQGIPTADDTIN